MKCSGQALSLTAAMCVCLFSFTSRPLYLSLTILDLIVRCGTKVRIRSYFYHGDIVQQLERDFLTATGTGWSRPSRKHHRPLLYAGGAKSLELDLCLQTLISTNSPRVAETRLTSEAHSSVPFISFKNTRYSSTLEICLWIRIAEKNKLCVFNIPSKPEIMSEDSRLNCPINPNPALGAGPSNE